MVGDTLSNVCLDWELGRFSTDQGLGSQNISDVFGSTRSTVSHTSCVVFSPFQVFSPLQVFSTFQVLSILHKYSRSDGNLMESNRKEDF